MRVIHLIRESEKIKIDIYLYEGHSINKLFKKEKKHDKYLLTCEFHRHGVRLQTAPRKMQGTEQGTVRSLYGTDQYV